MTHIHVDISEPKNGLCHFTYLYMMYIGVKSPTDPNLLLASWDIQVEPENEWLKKKRAVSFRGPAS